MNKVTVDARGLACPLPVFNAKKAAEEMKNGGVLEVLVDNEIAVQNLKKFAGQKGYTASGEKTAEKIIEYRNKIPFHCKEDLLKINGIGEKKYEILKELISV